jgi:hypothetical protein
MNYDDIAIRMENIGKPIEEAILHCDNSEDLMMLASIMLTRAKYIFQNHLGEDGRKELFDLMNG